MCFRQRPRRYTSCRFLPEIGKSSGILATLGVSVEHFGITLHTEGLTLTTGGLLDWREATRKSIQTVQQDRTVQSYLVAGYNRI